MQDLCNRLEANLTSRSQLVRRDTLRLLSYFHQDTSQPTGETIFDKLVKVESATLSLNSEGSMITAIESLKAGIEFHTIANDLIPIVIRALIGALNIR